MKATRRLLLFLVIANILLAGVLLSEFRKSEARQNIGASEAVDASASPRSNESKPAAPAALNKPATIATSPFKQMYSDNAVRFAANLREIGCPEETVKDILVAEISRRYEEREKALRPTPADHVPITWSANPSERKLFQRRQQAAAITREKRAALREALGYEVEVPLPVYAQSTSERRFEASLRGLSDQQRRAVLGVHEEYWNQVEILSERTEGFWQPDDVVELEQLKTERKMLIDDVLKNP